MWNFVFYFWKTHRLSSVFNLLSLSLAFAVFYVLMVQVNWEWRFDRFHHRADSIYRVELERNGSLTTILPYWQAERMGKYSSYIEKYGICFPQFHYCELLLVR